ncbi:unnamed protein product, partial [Rotaria magnacalcarata]
PEIGDLLKNKLNITLHQSLKLIFESPSDIDQKGSSIYLNTLSSILHEGLTTRKQLLLSTCPYTCNQPLSSQALASLQPYLKKI